LAFVYLVSTSGKFFSAIAGLSFHGDYATFKGVYTGAFDFAKLLKDRCAPGIGGRTFSLTIMPIQRRVAELENPGSRSVDAAAVDFGERNGIDMMKLMQACVVAFDDQVPSGVG
jgi:hypothetical protein